MNKQAVMRRFLHEPLLHFLVLGALLFVLYGWVNRHADTQSPNEIVIDQQRAQTLAGEFQNIWQRQPTSQEFQSLVDKWVHEEVLYREGLAQGFDRNDPVVRRRVVQKMSFLADSFASTAPTDAQLQAWLDAHPKDYQIEPRVSFEQVYFDPLKHPHDLTALMTSAKSELEHDVKAKVGDAIMLPASLSDASSGELASSFGDQFAKALTTLPVGQWQGPVRSGFGLHLVRVTARQDARTPQLAEVHKEVERDWVEDSNQRVQEEFYQGLRKGYAVKMDFDAKAFQPPGKPEQRVAGNP